MNIPYDMFTGAFLSKITEFDLLQVGDQTRRTIVDGYMKQAVNAFINICKCNYFVSADDVERTYTVSHEDGTDLSDGEVTEIVSIVSEGMVVFWMKPYLNRQENLELVMNTRDYTTYSSAELLYRVGEAYKRAQADFTNMMREYSFNHGDLSDLHL